MKKNKCLFCGKEYNRIKYITTKNFCSYNCYKKNYKRQFNIILKIKNNCLYCHNEFKIKSIKHPDQRYCSKKCNKSHFWRKNNPVKKIKKNCFICKNEFICNKYNPNQKFCSKKCSRNFWNKSEKIKIYKSEYIKLWRQNNPGYWINLSIRKLERKKSIIHQFIEQEFQNKLNETKGICSGFNCEPHCIGIENLTLDHIYPISKAFEDFLKTGIKQIYTINDIQFLCQSCNSSKNNFLIINEE